MSDTIALRRTVTGLLSFAAAEETELLAAAAFRPDYDRGSPDKWAGTATWRSCGKLSPEGEPAGSLAWSRIRRKGLLCSTPPASTPPRCPAR